MRKRLVGIVNYFAFWFVLLFVTGVLLGSIRLIHHMRQMSGRAGG